MQLSLLVNSCDIKPENVLLQSKQLPYRVKLADFGLGEGLLDVQGAVRMFPSAAVSANIWAAGRVGTAVTDGTVV